MQTYVVQNGDTLYGISKQFGVSVEEIKQENDIVNNSIFVGQVLRIPSTETVSFYIVKPNDTLYGIASKYNISVEELVKTNGIKNNQLYVGQKLIIPINGISQNNDFIIYTVKVGDNLYSLAKRYGVSVSEIIELNDLSSNILLIGQKLKIPIDIKTDNDYQYSTYIVQSGDTLYSIAKKYNMTINQLMKVNNLETNNLNIGQVLKVQNVLDNNLIPLGSSCYGDNYQEVKYLKYTVKKGDSLYLIAKKYGVSVVELMELNNLKNNNLQIGQVLKIKEIDL